MVRVGLTYRSEIIVKESDTALHVGSGDLPVLATPKMLSLMENAAMMAIADELPKEATSVGSFIESSHLKPSKVGECVYAIAEVVEVVEKKIVFKVSAYAGDRLIGEGTHHRFIVDRERFMNKLLQKA